MCSALAAAVFPQASPLTRLTDAFDQLQGEDPLVLSSVELGERLADLFTLRNRLDAAITRHVRAFDRTRAFAAHDARSSAAWLRGTVRLSPGAASEQVRVARQLDDLPGVSRSYAAGDVSLQHCQVITRVLEDAPAEVVHDSEPHLVQAALRTDPHRLGMLTRHLRHIFDPEGCADEALRAYERRRLHISESWEGHFFIDG